MSQTDAIFSQTSDQPIFSVSKVGRAAATDLSWLSMYSYKKDRAQRGPLKAFWLRAQWDKNTNCSVCQWFSSSIPSLYTAALRILSWGGLLSGVDGGQNVFKHAMLFNFQHFDVPFVPLTIRMLWSRSPVNQHLVLNFPSKCCLINNPATFPSP